MIGKQPMVSIVNTAIGICSIFKVFCGYPAMLGKCLAHTLHLPMCLKSLKISCHSLDHQ